MHPTSAEKTAVTVALLGNPNTGKSTLFNALAGMRQRVGNYPGVTVEKKTGQVDFAGQRFLLVDLPGTYSLAPRSLDEMVTVDVLLGRRSDVPPPDVVLCIVDASNLERNLYLVSQVLELGRPVVVALNMTDVAAELGLKIDVRGLGQRLGLPVIPLQAHRQVGIDALKQALADAAARSHAPVGPSPLPDAFQRELEQLATVVRDKTGRPLPRFLVERLLLDTGGYLEHAEFSSAGSHLAEVLAATRSRLEHAGVPIPAVEAMSRYGWVAEMVAGVVHHPVARPVTWTDRLDRVLTHKLWGTAVFALLMVLIFQAIFSWAAPLMGLIEGTVESFGQAAGSGLPAGALRSLVVDGIIAGVGGVLVFLPQILILFFFIAVLEDCGYMARAAYLMDKLMSRIGLSGKSFIPLLSSFACAIPGVMATRVIENRRDRLATILIAPLMSCSARLPVYVLLISAFIPDQPLLGRWLGLQGVTMASLYALGMLTAALVALVLKRTLLRGDTPPFVLELPGYKFPALRTVVWRMLDRGWSFVRRAGTLILAVSIVVWALAYFPRPAAVLEQVRTQYAERFQTLEGRVTELRRQAAHGSAGVGYEQIVAVEQELAGLHTQFDNQLAGAYIEQSFLGRLGHMVEPVVRPLGWDWRIGCAVIASFPAREVVIGAMGVIYNLGEDQDESSTSLQEELQQATWSGSGERIFTVPVALSIMVFFALCAQCVATLVIIRRETNSWRWPVFTFGYMTSLAYLAALLTYQLGSCL